MPTLGLVVNPIAGMGGRVALKGTDGADALREARARGATPMAAERALRALARLPQDIRIVAAPGAMGADVVARAGLECEVTQSARGGETAGAWAPGDKEWAAAGVRAAGGADTTAAGVRAA